MTSEVYARKWRPSVFADLVGQEHITSVLQNSLRTSRLAHSYIFCGPRMAIPVILAPYAYQQTLIPC